jgi:hypothetical protein
MAKQLSECCKFVRLSNAVAAGTTDITSTFVDTAGFEGVCFVVELGAITGGAVTSAKLIGSALADGSNPYDLAATAQTIADTDDNKIVLLDLYQSRDRYVGVLVDRGTANAVVDSIYAILYDPRKLPVVQDAALVLSEVNIAPLPGTA